MTIKEIMKKPISIKQDDEIYDLIKLLRTHKISGVPVLDNDNYLVGIVSESDVIRALVVQDSDINLIAPSPLDLVELPLKTIFKMDEYRKEINEALKTKVSEIMTTDVIYITADSSVSDAATLMADKKINRLPVVNNGILEGIITRGDLMEELI
ncbi:CBS domain-containing protein [Methanococcus voltae]|uniref:CBS domain-containing protein n=1 Tax=Methanococcus voltae TaxID=2188 RepID=UPI001AE55AB7|nr:CBS domain-containing protein [Methanococcus voltae]MBP2143301.1 CBS domain-containing protein [Methanococcus voltae]